MRVQRQVKGEQVDLVPQQQLQPLLEPTGNPPVLTPPEEPMVHKNRIRALLDGGFDQRTAGRDGADQPDDLAFAFDLKAVRPIIAEPIHVEQVVEVGLDCAP